MARKKSTKQSTLSLVSDTKAVQTGPVMPVLVPRPNGRGALNSGGTPGNPGGGRPRDEFKAMCRELSSSAEVYTTVQKILADPILYENLYIGALKWATEHGYGKADQKIESNTTVTVRQEWTFGVKKVAF